MIDTAVCMALIDDENEKQAFEKLFNEYKNLMYKTAFDILNNVQDSEDAVSEAFLRIAKYFHFFNKNVCQKTRNQFVIIVRNIAIDKYRQNSKRYDRFEEIENFDEKASNYDCHDGIVELAECIKMLPCEYRDVIYLQKIYSYSAKETAKLLGISENAVYKRVERAKSMIKEMLDSDE